MKAYRICVDGIKCIAYAASMAKARWIAVRAYREFYLARQRTWPSIQCRRAPELDGFYDSTKAGRALAEEHLIEGAPVPAMGGGE